MGKGRRFDSKTKGTLNIKKVIAAIIGILVVAMFVLVIIKLLKVDKTSTTEKKVSLSYYAAYLNNKWGVIDSNGNTILEPNCDEMVLVPNPKEEVFIVTYNVDYSAGTYDSKAVNEKNEQLFTEYEEVEVIENHNKQNSIWYVTNALRVKKNGKYGLIDYSGKVLLNCDYDDISPIIGVKNSLVTEKDGKKGLVTTTGSIIINNEYTEITALTNSYENGYIVKNDEGKYGIIGTSKKTLVDVSYDDVKHVNSGKYYIVKLNGKWFILNSETKETIDFNYDDVNSINGDYIVVQKSNKYGLVKTTGEEVITPKYESLQYVFSDCYIAELNGKYGAINSEDTVKINLQYNGLEYIETADFFEGETDNIETDLINNNFEVKLSGIVSEINIDKGYMKIRIGEDYKYYNFKFEEKTNKELLTTNTLFLSKQNNKYGFIDKNGVVIVNYIYDDATEQNDNGISAIKLDGKWGAIDSKGNVIVEPTYTLNNNAKIDFIGTWHIAEDVNALYYTK